MYLINQINIEHINNLKDIELSELLHLLLTIEAQKEKLEGWDASVPFNITTADAGSDGKMIWTGKPDKTYWLKSKFIIFQNKATTLGPSECYEEILEKRKKGTPRKLKSQIEKLVNAAGRYILFTNKSISDAGKDERIENFKRAIKDAGHVNANSFDIEIYDANKIKDWVNANMLAVLFVQKLNGISRPLGFRSWEEWGIDIAESATPFQSNSISEGNIISIQETLKNEKVIRISGHSGLGKTRLVFEAFRPLSNESQFIYDLVYYDVGLTNNSAEISNFILSHRNEQQGTIVIDNCDSEIHEKLSSLIRFQGRLKIITIGFDDRRSIQDPKIRLDKNNQRDLVSLIVDQKLGTTHDSTDRGYIKDLSEGYPWMAVKFCDSVLKNGMTNLSQYPLDEFIQKLLFGTQDRDKLEYAVIRACSVFSAFGFLDDSLSGLINPDVANTLQTQMDFIRQEVYDGNLTDSQFREICYKFRKEDIIEKRGTFYIVKPSILAVNLASNWLMITAPMRIKQIIETLKNVNLEEKFIDRLTDLDQLDKAKDLVTDLWGTQGFFGSAEVLNTQWGSLLFRYVVEVNPVSTSNSLSQAFSNWTKEELFNATEGRRNLVWALEKLCFRKETFLKSAKILYAFAVSENESWSNNATHQFIQLFQLFIPGTEAALDKRLEIIRWGLEKNDEDYSRVAILALGRAIFNHGHTRGGGAENQGTSPPLKDYVASWPEARSYWAESILVLTNFACLNNPNGDLAKSKLSTGYRTLLRDGMLDEVVESIVRVAKNSNSVWIDGISALKKAISYENLNMETIERLQKLIEEITPRDIVDQIILKVSKPEWFAYGKAAGNYIDRQREIAEGFAEELVQKNIEWLEYLQYLLKGEQRQGFAFGHKLGEIILNKQEFIEKAFRVLSDIPQIERNIELIGGFMVGANDKELSNEIFKILFENRSLNQYAFYMTRLIQPTLEDLSKLFVIIDNNNELSISHFRSLQYGRALDKLTPEEVIQLCKRIATYKKEGQWSSLSLISMYCYQNEERWNSCLPYLKTLISQDNMIVSMDNINSMDSFHWFETVQRLINNTNDVELAKTISYQILEFSAQANSNYSAENNIVNLMKILLAQYFATIWPIIGSGLIDNSLTYLNLKRILGSKNGSYGYQGILFENENIYPSLLIWAKEHPEIAPKRLAYMMPLGIKNDEIKWHPFSLSIINEFGDQEKVLNELSANMGSFSFTGSSIGYYQIQKILLKILLNNPRANVREWAQQMIIYTDNSIKREEIDNDEQFLK